MELTEIIEAVSKLDRAGVEAVFTAVQARNRSLRQSAALVNKATLTAGTRVITQGLSPKYLCGLPGQVVDTPARRAGDLTIEVDPSHRRLLGRYGNAATGHLGVPAGALRTV